MTTSRSSKLLLPSLTAFAAVVYAWGFSQGSGHYYYSAAVRTMAADWSAFLFGALDPALSMTIDKAAGALWPQALAVRLFGFHTWVLLLPGVLATAATVPMLFAAVRRCAGPVAATIAALVLTTSPVTFATMRVNLADSVLVFLLVAAAYFVVRSFDDARLRWPLGAAVLVGLAFQAKMIEAWLVVPAVVAALAVRRRFVAAGAFVLVTTAVSLSWLVVVSVVPRPVGLHVDGSPADSFWQMVFGYNGLGRTTAGGSALSATAAPYGGPAGPLRLLDEQLGGQIGWLLPLAVVVLVAGWWTHRRDPGWTLWGTWLVTTAVVLSAVGGIHPYYATVAVPALAAVLGHGVTAAWRRRWVLPVGVTASAAAAFVVASRTGTWWLATVVPVLAVAAVILWLPAGTRRPATVLGAAAMLAGPLAWIALTPPVPRNSMHSTNPVAGPQTAAVVFGNPDPRITLARILGIPPHGPAPAIDAPLPGADTDPRLLDYLQAQHHGEQYLFATGDASTASPYIAQSLSVLPLGGFTGFSPYPGEDELTALVHTGKLRYVYLVATPGLPGALAQRADWATHHCNPVPPDAYGGRSPVPTLFDCRDSGHRTHSPGTWS